MTATHASMGALIVRIKDVSFNNQVYVMAHRDGRPDLLPFTTDYLYAENERLIADIQRVAEPVIASDLQALVDAMAVHRRTLGAVIGVLRSRCLHADQAANACRRRG
jgi:hypothetical protein